MECISNAMVICFIDNNSARDISISAPGRSSFSMALVEVLCSPSIVGRSFLGTHESLPLRILQIALQEMIRCSLTRMVSFVQTPGL